MMELQSFILDEASLSTETWHLNLFLISDKMYIYQQGMMP